MTNTAIADIARDEPLGLTADERALLERHKPILRFDRQYDYRPASVLGVVENAGNVLRTGHGELVARAGGEPPLSLDVLGAYMAEFDAVEDDCLCLAPDVLGDAREMERRERFAGPLYARVKDDGGRTWLQYWFWLYYNPKNLFGFGKHEGDWEMVQVGLGANGDPEVATYAQHDSCEARRFRNGPMEIDVSDGTPRPVVYVASLSHASYFKSGTHPYPTGIDHAYGDGPADPLPLQEFGDWVKWGGHWGNVERAVGRRVGRGPRSPMHQGDKWNHPAAFHASAKWSLPRAMLGRLLHLVGNITYPKAPILRASMDGERRCRVEWEFRQSPWRRSRHLYLTVHDEKRVVASRTLRKPPRKHHASLRVPPPEDRGRLVVAGSSFNFARQRSNLAEADVR
jgi:hypothetical protein